MPLQNQVYTTVAQGIPGMKADMNIFDYYPNTLTAAADITVGTFVWLGTPITTPDGVIPAFTGVYNGTGAPVGFVERNLVYPNFDITSEGSEIIAEGETLTVATRGAFWAKTSTAATVGQAVIAAAADGTISTGAVGDAGDTGWVVCTPADAGDIIIIKRS